MTLRILKTKAALAAITLGSLMSLGSTAAMAQVSYGSSYSGVLSQQHADHVYGTGSVSETYSFSGPQTVSHVSTQSVPGLGLNERLCPTTCPTAVYNPEGGQVKACYAVCKPATVRVVVRQPVLPVRVVHPVVVVPVAVPTPYYCGTRTIVKKSRYGYGSPRGHGRVYNDGTCRR